MKKNFKNLMALVLTGAMLTAGAAAFAATPSSYTGGATMSGAISGSGGSVVTSGAQTINVIIPMSIPDFVLDPASSMSMIASSSPEIEKGATMYFASEYEDPFADNLVATKYGSQSAPAYFRNEGIMPVNLKATVEADNSGSNMHTYLAKDFTNAKTSGGATADIAISVSAINKNGDVVAPPVDIDDKAATDPSKAIINTVIDDSRDQWSLEQDSTNVWKLNYTSSGEATAMARTGITLKGEANVAFDWEAGYKNSTTKIDPTKYTIKMTYELSQVESTVAKIDSMKDTDKVELTLTGLKKATGENKNPLVIRGIETAEKKGTNDYVADATSIPGVTIANDKVTITKAGLQAILGQWGGGVATLMISAPGSQGAVITIRN